MKLCWLPYLPLTSCFVARDLRLQTFAPRHILKREIARSKDMFSFSGTDYCQIALHSSHASFLANAILVSAHLIANGPFPSQVAQSILIATRSTGGTGLIYDHLVGGHREAQG